MQHSVIFSKFSVVKFAGRRSPRFGNDKTSIASSSIAADRLPAEAAHRHTVQSTLSSEPSTRNADKRDRDRRARSHIQGASPSKLASQPLTSTVSAGDTTSARRDFRQSASNVSSTFQEPSQPADHTQTLNQGEIVCQTRLTVQQKREPARVREVEEALRAAHVSEVAELKSSALSAASQAAA
eukprot:SAG31_NODE_10037_length_1192_cov_1.864593_2_plen_182_part_01